MNRTRIGLLAGAVVIGAVIVGLSAAAAPAAAVLQPEAAERASVGAFLEGIRAKHKLPALAGALVRADGVVEAGAVGVRRAGHEEPVTIDDKFHIGSDTKAMTCVLLAMLVQEGKLRWDSTVAEVFGDLGWAVHDGLGGVTLEQLVTHRGGLPANLPNQGWWSLSKEEITAQRREYAAAALAREPEYPPGSKMLYSNAGYVVAGAMAEKVTGKSWESLMRERIFGPLGMESAGFGAPATVGEADQPWGHAVRRSRQVPVGGGPGGDNPAVLGPAGTVHCSMGDWAKFIAADLAGQQGRESLGLPGGAWRELHTPPAGEYAFGWLITERSWGGGKVSTHAGSNTMWFAVVWVAPGRDIAMLAATNVAGADAAKACDEVVAGLLGRNEKRQ